MAWLGGLLLFLHVSCTFPVATYDLIRLCISYSMGRSEFEGSQIRMPRTVEGFGARIMQDPPINPNPSPRLM